MTAREIADKYYPQLIIKMADPTSAIRFCEAFNPPHTKMNEITKGVPDNQLRNVWNIIKTARYREDPNPVIREMKEMTKKLQEGLL